MADPLPTGRPERPPGGAGTGLQSKMMGLPVWAWVALAAAGGITFFIWRQKKSSADTITPQPVVDSESLVSTEQYESLLALLRDLQGQGAGEEGDTPPTTVPTPPGKEPTAHPVGGSPPPLDPTLPKGTGWDFVRKGDTLAKIAARWNTTVDALKMYNSAKGLNKLSVGEPIRIRTKAGPRP